MTDFTQQFPYHPIGERVLNILRTKSLNKSSDTYFRVLIGYYFAQMASNMRCNVKSNFFGDTPVNVYCMCFMQSGCRMYLLLRSFTVKETRPAWILILRCCSIRPRTQIIIQM